MLTTIERVRLLSDEFSSVSDDRLTMYIEDATNEVSSFNFPEQYQERLTRYLAAHFVALSVTKAQAVILEKVDVIERQYSDPNKNFGLLATKFGQEYQRMLEELQEQFKPKKCINLMVL